MARKNLIEAAPPSQADLPLASSRPLAGFVTPSARSAPVGGISKTLGNITEKVERAQQIEKQLALGQAVVELNPELIDSSFVRDRLEIDASELDELVGQIREHGQQVPILVRPHPETEGRYQVAFGHRRLAAVRRLGGQIKAVVRALSDDQLVVSQGQENNARTNLSYIERAIFAVRLETMSFARDTIMAALGVDKAALSKMIGVGRSIPLGLIEAIGPAPAIGRRRWMELAELVPTLSVDKLIGKLSADNSLSSDGRFEFVVREATRKHPATHSSGESAPWASTDGRVSVSIKTARGRAVLTCDAPDGPQFAAYVTQQLDQLYTAFQRKKQINAGD